MSKKTGLGKGLSALIPDSLNTQEAYSLEQSKLEQDALKKPGSELRQVPLADIERNPYQPRTVFDDEKLTELTASIQEVGVLQPILLREQNGRYELIAGERRWLAARRAGLSSMPAVVRKIQDIESLEHAIIENLHREDFNAIDEAVAYHRLMDEFNMTQQQVSEKVGRSRPAIANSLRLLNLSSDIQRLIMDGSLSAGHARCLVGLTDRKIQEKLTTRIVSEALSVRQLESIITEIQETTDHRDKEKVIFGTSFKEASHLEVEKILSERFNTKVSVVSRGKKGRIVIEFADADDLKRIFSILE